MIGIIHIDVCAILSHGHCPSFTSSWIAVGERERTRALPGEILYPSTSSAASAASARAFVGAP